MLINRVLDGLQEPQAVRIIRIDRAAFVAPGRGMIDGVDIFHTDRSYHNAGMASASGANRQVSGVNPIRLQNWGDKGEHYIGQVDLQANRRYRLSVKPGQPWQAVNVRRVILQPTTAAEG